jgi:hypothetical protein
MEGQMEGHIIFFSPASGSSPEISLAHALIHPDLKLVLRR